MEGADQPSRVALSARAIAGGTQIMQTRDTPRGISPFARAFTRALLGGQPGHDDELEVGMRPRA